MMPLLIVMVFSIYNAFLKPQTGILSKDIMPTSGYDLQKHYTDLINKIYLILQEAVTSETKKKAYELYVTFGTLIEVT